MAASLQQQTSETSPKNTDITLIVNRIGIMYKTTGEYPEFETKRPLKGFVSVDESDKITLLQSIGSKVVHIVVDPLMYDGQFLKLVKDVCVNAKQLTMDANLLELDEYEYHKKVSRPRGEKMCRNLVTFLASFDKIEELHFAPKLNVAEEIYSRNYWGWENRFGALSGECSPKLSTDFINNLNTNLKTIFFNYALIDSFDLRSAGHRCPIMIKPLKVRLINLFDWEDGPAHTCLNKLPNLKSVSVKYFENCFHSDTVGELILETLSEDNKVHDMFPNLKKIRVEYFCPYVMGMSGTGNPGPYDGVVLDELEVEVQMPCFRSDGREVQSSRGISQVMNFISYRFSATRRCQCFDKFAQIEPLKQLKVIKLRCFDNHVGRFISELQKIGCKADIIVYEKSRFERNPDHQSLWNNLRSLESAMKIVPHNKIELIMKKVDESEVNIVESKLRKFVPADVRISFTE